MDKLPPGTHAVRLTDVKEQNGKIFATMELATKDRKSEGGGKTVCIAKLLEGFDEPIHVGTPIAISHAQHVQFIGRVKRKNVIDPRSKNARKLAKLDYELNKLKANFELNAGLAYRTFLAGIVHNSELGKAVAASQSPIAASWYTDLLYKLGYAPSQLKLPKPRGQQ